MTNKSRVINIVKNVVIVLLMISAVYLLLTAVVVTPTQFFDGLFGAPSDAPAAGNAGNAGSSVVSVPSTILTTNEVGIHYAVKYDYQIKSSIFASLSASFGEALGTSTSPVEIRESDWRSALRRECVYFDYLYSRPLSIIALHLGTSINPSVEDAAARRFILGNVDGELCLYYKDEYSGDYFRVGTALKYSAISGKIAGNALGQAVFAFESDEKYELLDPYFVFADETVSAAAVSSITPFLSADTNLITLESFSMNSRTSLDYSESDGSVVYVDGNKMLRISTSGSALFTVTGSDGIPVEHSGGYPTLDDCIAAASGLIQKTLAVSSGDSEIGLIETEKNSGRGNYTLNFGYYVNGIPLEMENTAWCAKIRVSGGNIVRAELIFRQYTVSNDSLPVMSENFAVIAAVKKGGGEPVLVYVDSSGTVSCKWTLAKTDVE